MRTSRFCALVVLSLLALWSQPVRAQQPGNPVNCVVTVSTATTITAFGAACLGGGRDAQYALYITDILFSASATGIAADAFPTVKYGTGTTCGTGTTIAWGALSAAALVQPQQLKTPIRIPPLNDLCWISSTAGSKFIVITGYVAP